MRIVSSEWAGATVLTGMAMNFPRCWLVIVAALSVGGCKRLETPESSFPDVQAAVAAGAVERGWVPAFLAPSAKELRERHDLDTNEVWLRYSFGEEAFVVGACRNADAAHIAKPRKSAGQWWPDTLTQKTPSEGHSSSFEYYQCTNGGFIAADHQTTTAYYWRGAS